MDLLPQQTLMADHLRTHAQALLFVGAGLGKTRAIIEVVEEFFVDGEIMGVLVVAPLRVATLAWPAEVERWSSWLKIVDLRTKEGQRAWKEGTAHIYTISYENLPKLCADEGPWPVDFVVWDESHFAKNPSSKRVKAFEPHRDKFSRRVAMTGTPLGNSYLDLFAQVRLVDHGERLGNNFHAFKNRYFDCDYMGFKWEPYSWAREVIQEKIADITLTLTSEEYLDIPPVTVVDVDVPLDATNTKLYRQLQKDFLVAIKDQNIVGVNAAALIGKLIQFTSGCCYDEVRSTAHIHYAKVDALKKIVDEVKEPVLVATHYVHERDMIKERIRGVEFFSEGSLDRWNTGEIKVLVVDPRSVGTGLNLQSGGRHIVWFSQTYSRLQYDQLNARLARTGQTKPVFIHRLLCPGTVDWAVVEALEYKGAEQEGLRAALKAIKMMKP